MIATGRVVLAAALLASGCDDAVEDSHAPTVPEEPPAAAEAPAPEEPAAIALDNGFLPDPHVVSGVASGTRSASALVDGCTGFVATEPDHFFEARGTFADLSILLDAEEDVSLVVALPDGSHRCEPASEDDGPTLRGTFRRGTHRLWIATPTASDEVAYRLAISELEQPSW